MLGLASGGGRIWRQRTKRWRENLLRLEPLEQRWLLDASPVSQDDFYTGPGAVQVAQLWGTEEADYAYFGSAVASEGSLMVVGAPDESSSLGNEAGAAYVFVKEDTWVPTVRLAPEVIDTFDKFGWSVATDGTRILVGSPNTNLSGNPELANLGAAFMYSFEEGQWVETVLMAPVEQQSYQLSFGANVAIEGDWAFVSTNTERAFSDESGKVFAFHFESGVWGYHSTLYADDPLANNTFGNALSLDGTVLAVGAPYDTTDGVQAGAAYLFEFDGGAWTQTARLTGSSTGELGLFGTDVSLDADRLAVAARNQSLGPDDGGGVTFIFERDGAQWIESAATSVSSPDFPLVIFFGSEHVSLEGDQLLVSGSRLVQKATGEGDYRFGAFVAVYRDGPDGWERVDLLVNDMEFSGFGIDMDLNSSELIIGAPSVPDGDTERAGTVYVYVVGEGESYLEDADVIVSADEGVLANDTPGDGAEWSAELLTQPEVGTLQFESDGSFQYSPPQDFFGDATFRYRAFDGTSYSQSAVVTIRILPVNDSPVAIDDFYLVKPGELLTTSFYSGVAYRDLDVDNIARNAQLVKGPLHGSLTLHTDGSFDYQPEAGFVGTDTFTYQTSDTQAFSEVALVTIDVRPTLGDVAVYSSLEDLQAAQEIAGVETFDELPNRMKFGGNVATIGDLTFTASIETAEWEVRGFSNSTPPNAIGTVEGYSEHVITFGTDGFVYAAGLWVESGNKQILVEEVDGRIETFTSASSIGYNGFSSPVGIRSISIRNFPEAQVGYQSDIDTVAYGPIHTVVAPAATNDNYAADGASELQVAAADGLLANDRFLRNAELTIELVDPPQIGTVELNPDGSFVYRAQGSASPPGEGGGGGEGPNESTQRFTYRISHGEAHSQLAEVVIESVSTPELLQVAEVRLASEQWSDSFAGLWSGGSQRGYSMPGGDDQLAPLPWSGLDQISIRFTDEAVVSAEQLQLTGINLPTYSVREFFYDPGTFTATWTLDEPLSADRVLLSLDGVTSAAGVPLDGNWSPTSTFPSGDGASTTDDGFHFVVNVLAGDITGDGQVGRDDLAETIASLGSLAGQSNYRPTLDANGDGRIAMSDLRDLLGRLFTRLPAGEPGSVADPTPLVSTDAVFDRIGAGGSVGAEMDDTTTLLAMEQTPTGGWGRSEAEPPAGPPFGTDCRNSAVVLWPRLRGVRPPMTRVTCEQLPGG